MLKMEVEFDYANSSGKGFTRAFGSVLSTYELGLRKHFFLNRGLPSREKAEGCSE